MHILAIASAVATGHVGNAAAVFALQRLGAEVTRLDTVRFSNHPGHGAFAGRLADPEELRALIDGLAAHGTLARCDAVLSGYLGAPGTGPVVLDAVARVRAARPAALYACDPVIGDDGPGEYVRPGIADFLRDRAVPAADLLTPNRFEAERLTGLPVATLAEARVAAAALEAAMRPAGPRVVLLTSLRTETTPADAIDMLAAEGGRFWRLRTPKLPIAVNGAGDMLAALFLFHRLATGDAGAALAAAAAALHGVLRRTARDGPGRDGTGELALIAAQDELVAPSRRFAAEPC